MTMHTPGPWRITGPNIRSDNHTDGTGALLFVQQRPFNDSEPDPEEQAANLKLVAAAPKLQAIVEGFLLTLDTNDAHQVHRYYDTNIELFNLAIDTIQELRGEAEGVSVMENCASCDQQGSDEHCLGHHDLAQGTIYAKCQDGCQDEGE